MILDDRLQKEVAMFRNLLKKSEPEIIAIKPPESHQNEWGGDGLVFYVKNGKGLLSTKYGYLERKRWPL